MRVLVTGARGKVGRGDGGCADGGRPTCARRTSRHRSSSVRSRRAGLLPGRPHRRGRRLRSSGALRRWCTPRHPGANPQPAARRLPEQPDVRLQRARGGHQVRRPAVRQHLERDGARLLLRGPFLPDYVQVDEEQSRPQDPYATAKHFSELLMDGAVRRSDIRPISIRPCWVQHEGNYERNLGPLVRLPGYPPFLSYIDVYDLADAIVLAVQSDLPGHEVFYIASPTTSGTAARGSSAGTTAMRSRSENPSRARTQATSP